MHRSINYIKRDVFQTFNIIIYQSHEFLYNNLFLHQLYNNLNQKKTCKHFYVINTNKLYEIEYILQKKGIEIHIIILE